MKILRIVTHSLLIFIIILILVTLLPKNDFLIKYPHTFRMWLQDNCLQLLIGGIALMCFATIRGTLRNALFSKKNDYIIIFTISSALLFIIAYINSGYWLVPNRPFLYIYIAGFFELLGLYITLIDLLLKINHYQYQTGLLAADEVINDRNNLSIDQITTLDNLKEILQNQQQIHSIGLFGDWGTGKTSIYQTAKNEIIKIDKNIIWVEIEPWRYTSQESLVLGFYEEIGLALENSIPGIQNSAKTLLQIAEPLVRTSDHTGFAYFIFNFIYRITKKSNKHPGEYISSTLEREGKYLIIAIDNVERNCDKLQVLRTLQLVHFLNARNTAYIFISEKEKLLSCIPEENKLAKTIYLEKFIEYELELLKPKKDELQNFFKTKLETIPYDFQLKNIDSLIEDFETYRGVVRIFNQFTLELSSRFYRDDKYLIKLEDKLTLDHIHLKYPLLWKHIEQNRDVYDEGLRNKDRFYRLIIGEDERDKQRQDIILKAIDQTVPEDKRSAIRSTIAELFPQTYHLLGHSSKKYCDYSEFRRELRVCHPDVLDNYFARSQNQEVYHHRLNKINKLIINLDKGESNENNIINLFKEYIESISKEPGMGDTIRLLTGELAYTLSNKDKLRLYLRCFLRSYSQYISYASLDRDDGILSNILSAINEFVEQFTDRENLLKIHLNYIFKDLDKYISHPSVILRILLYLLPERDNSFYAIKKWGDGFNKLRRKGLVYVDNFYLSQTNTNIFLDHQLSYEWRFILYQWALSIETNNSTRASFSGSKVRFKRVNEYFFNILNRDHKLAYDIIKSDFYGKEWSSEIKDNWHISIEKLSPYDTKKMRALATKLCSSNILNRTQRQEMDVFLKCFSSTTSTARG